MSEYALARTRSAAVIPSGYSPPTVLLTRTYSVPDVTSYIRASDRYKPMWPSYYTSRSYYPYRYYRDYSLYDDYWYDRYYYFSPNYSRSLFPRRYFYSDYTANPYYWSYPSYWTRYKSYTYGYGYPYTYRRYGDPYYDSYLSPYYRPYRSYLLDSMTQSFLAGLVQYRQGLISFGNLDAKFLKTDQWDQRYKNLKDLHHWHNQSVYLPGYYNRNARHYQTEWAQ